MTSKENILTEIHCAFGDLPRPDVMTRDPTHCDECAEHEKTMQGVTPETVSLQEIGNEGWDPVCYLSDESYCYFMPGFTRLAFGRGGEYYLSSFLFHLDSGRHEILNKEQKESISLLLDYIFETMSDEISSNGDDIELARTMDKIAGCWVQSEFGKE